MLPKMEHLADSLRPLYQNYIKTSNPILGNNLNLTKTKIMLSDELG